MGVKSTLLWTGTVRTLPLEGQLAVARDLGCSRLSVSPYAYTKWLAEGLSTVEMLAMAEDFGVRISHLDPYARWIKNWRSNNLDTKKYPAGFRGFAEDDFFRIADALGVESMSAIVSCDAESTSFDEMCEGLARTCDRAAEFGMRCDVEFIPVWGLPDLESAWKLLNAVDRPNTGLVFDFWHFCRGTSDKALLDTIPGDRISGVQITDAEAVVPEGRSLVEDTLSHRLSPGEGGLPIVPLLQQLDRIGGLNGVGPEVFSAKLDTLDAGQITEVCASSLSWLFNEAGIKNPFTAPSSVVQALA